MGPGWGKLRGRRDASCILFKCVALATRSADAPDRQVDAADDDAAFAGVARDHSRRWLTVAAAAVVVDVDDESPTRMTLQHLLYVRRDASRS